MTLSQNLPKYVDTGNSQLESVADYTNAGADFSYQIQVNKTGMIIE